MDVISYKLPVFEGPLDLLLFLVQKNKLNICDIPIAEILDQYMDAIRQMQETDLEVATEFLDMAARLVQIKSAMLLPRHEEETEQLKKELSGELERQVSVEELSAFMDMPVEEIEDLLKLAGEGTGDGDNGAEGQNTQ